MDTTGRILFVCPACGYRAKIPGNYLGMSIKCPGCNGAQTVIKPEKTESTGKTVSITRVATTPLPFTVDQAKQPFASSPAAPPAPAAPAAAPRAMAVTRTPLPGSLVAGAPPATQQERALPSGAAAQTIAFTCTACAYRARIPVSYGGRTILCPSCKAAQVAPTAATPSASGQTAVIARVITATPAAGSAMLADSRPVERAEKPAVGAAALDLNEKILVTCAACGLRARLPAKYAGQTIKCPKCTKAVAVPLSQAVEEATGNTVSITRADLQETSTRPPAQAAKRPSGEIAMPPTRAAAAPAPAGLDQDLSLDLGLGEPAAPSRPQAAEVPSSPLGNPILGSGDSALSAEDDLDLSGKNRVIRTAARKGWRGQAPRHRQFSAHAES